MLGVNRTNLAWDDASVRKTTVEAIRSAGIPTVRLSWREPRRQMVDVLSRASERGLAVLIEIPLASPVAKPGTSPRPGAGPLGPRVRLSNIDVAAFEAYVAAALADLQQSDVSVAAIQIGNEVNWADFNGDLPLLGEGTMWRRIEDIPAPHRQDFERGLSIYAELIRVARKLLDRSPRFRNVPIITAGLADVGESWAARVGGTVVSRDAMLKRFAELAIFQNVDGVGLHVYRPFLPGRDVERSLPESLVRCGTAATGNRPCWLTEFGSPATSKGCETTDTQRREQIETAAEIVERLGPGAVAGAFLFDWDQGGAWSIVRCGALTDAGDAFATWARFTSKSTP